MRSKKVDISTLVLNEANPRFIKDGKFKKLMKSIKEFPQMLSVRPVVVDEAMIVLGGNMRVRACIELGYKELPVVQVTGYSNEQKLEFIAKDNIGYGEWDWDMLHNGWDVAALDDWGLDITWPEPLEGEDVKEEKEPAESYVCEHCGSTVKV